MQFKYISIPYYHIWFRYLISRFFLFLQATNASLITYEVQAATPKHYDELKALYTSTVGLKFVVKPKHFQFNTKDMFEESSVNHDSDNRYVFIYLIRLFSLKHLRENHGSYECIYIIWLKGPRISSTWFKVEVYCKYKLSVLEIQREICRIYKTPTNCIAYVYCKGWGKLSRRCHFRWIYLLFS